MSWKFDEKSPIYVQIAQHIKMQIISQEIKSGDQLPTVRELAEEAGVNPNTMQKALSDFESTGLVHSERTSGRFITNDDNLIKELRKSLVDVQIEEFFKNMGKLGFTGKEIIQLVEQHVEK